MSRFRGSARAHHDIYPGALQELCADLEQLIGGDALAGGHFDPASWLALRTTGEWGPLGPWVSSCVFVHWHL
jgi:hypothetical protein